MEAKDVLQLDISHDRLTAVDWLVHPESLTKRDQIANRSMFRVE